MKRFIVVKNRTDMQYMHMDHEDPKVCALSVLNLLIQGLFQNKLWMLYWWWTSYSILHFYLYPPRGQMD